MSVRTAFLKKEWLETVRTGKFAVLTLLFLLLGIMSPALAKLTPWLMELMADTMAESGLIVTEVEVNALTSWTQFFKNIPMGLIIFVLITGGSFTREYASGTLIPVLTKGLPRYRVVLAKSVLLLALWSFCYWLCFGVTYGYNAYFWDNGIAERLASAAVCWWLFGVWILCLVVLFSNVTGSVTGVYLGTGGIALLSYLIGRFPAAEKYTPALLMDMSSHLAEEGGGRGAEGLGTAVAVTVICSCVCIAGSILALNRKQL